MRGNDSIKLVGKNRLGHKIIHACGKAAFLVFLPDIGGQGNNKRAGQGRVTAYLPGGFKAIQQPGE